MRIYFKWVLIFISSKHLFSETLDLKQFAQTRTLTKWPIISFSLNNKSNTCNKKKINLKYERPRVDSSKPLWSLDRLTLHSFVPELCMNLSFRKKGHQQARAAGAETVCASTPSANIETAAPFNHHKNIGGQVRQTFSLRWSRNKHRRVRVSTSILCFFLKKTKKHTEIM